MKTKLAFTCMLLCLAGTLPAQDTRGTINGGISDPSGAVIPGATVLITNTAMGQNTTTKTNQDGYYQAAFLMPGSYRIEAVAQGFKKAIQDDVQVRVADRL